MKSVIWLELKKSGFIWEAPFKKIKSNKKLKIDIRITNTRIFKNWLLSILNSVFFMKEFDIIIIGSKVIIWKLKFYFHKYINFFKFKLR